MSCDYETGQGQNCGKCNDCLRVNGFFLKDAVDNLRASLEAVTRERDAAASITYSGLVTRTLQRAEAAEMKAQQNACDWADMKERAEVAEQALEVAQAQVDKLAEALREIAEATQRAKVEVEGITIDRPAFVMPNVCIHHLDAIKNVARAALADAGKAAT